MADRKARGSAPPEVRPKCLHCGSTEIHTMTVPWYRELEYLTCGYCKCIWTDERKPKGYARSGHDRYVSCRYAEDWQLACALRVNVVLTGRPVDTRALVEALRPSLPEPVVIVPHGASSDVTTAAPHGTVILEDVSSFGVADQRRLLTWLDEQAPTTRVISTTSVPIVPLIEAGAFLESLYYRLNTIYCEVTAARRASY